MIEVTPKEKLSTGLAVGCGVNWQSQTAASPWLHKRPLASHPLWYLQKVIVDFPSGHSSIYRPRGQKCRHPSPSPVPDLRVGKGKIHAFAAEETSKMKVK